ncbi:hypothetical protein [Gordonia sp. (in: high G+C Gram-positive bacteria)]|uniref:hypothetical protein n=1 Tax=Gordonia sp. (in: high G+C Gram-positive bacteria) TaxID=84139 RepID=UPI0035B0A08C
MVDAKKRPAGHLDLPFRTWIEYYQDALNLVHLTYDGLNSIDFRIELGDILRGFRLEVERGRDQVLRDALLVKSRDAHREIDADYPVLHAHTLLGLWGALERLIEDIFITSILYEPSLLAHERLSRVKLLVDVILGSGEDRANAILAEFIRTIGADQKKGVGQFEALLKPVLLDGQVPRVVRDSVLLAQQIRHVWAHRGGVADAKFVESCSSRASVGDKLLIGSSEFHHLSDGIQMYGLVVLNRHFLNSGMPIRTTIVPGYEGIWDEIGMGGNDINAEEDAPRDAPEGPLFSNEPW